MYFSDSTRLQDHFWIGLYLPANVQDCGCDGNTASRVCQECKNQFIWVDGSENIPEFWALPTDPADGQRCVRLREAINDDSVWTGTDCNLRLKYICKAGI